MQWQSNGALEESMDHTSLQKVLMNVVINIGQYLYCHMWPRFLRNVSITNLYNIFMLIVVYQNTSQLIQYHSTQASLQKIKKTTSMTTAIQSYASLTSVNSLTQLIVRLLNKMECFDILCSELEWCTDYLGNRSHCVYINGKCHIFKLCYLVFRKVLFGLLLVRPIPGM